MKISMMLFILSSLVSFSGLASVEIQYAGNSLKFDANPRLSSVIERVMVSTDFYWHGGSLYSLTGSQSKTAKRALLQELDALLSKTGIMTSKYTALSQLKQQVSNWNVADKLDLELDFDLIRIRNDLDPRLDDGKYLLHLPFRSYTVNVIGAVKEVRQVPHLAAVPVGEYFDKAGIALLDYADREFVFVIHPNGSVKKVSVSAYSQEYVEVAPGGTIYVPIRELPFDSTNKGLNDKIAKLAGNVLP